MESICSIDHTRILALQLSKFADSITKVRKIVPFLIKKVMVGLLCEENLCVCNFFVNSTRWHEEGGIIHLNSVNNTTPVIHQLFGESNIQVVILPLEGRKANQTKLFQAVTKENAR